MAVTGAGGRELATRVVVGAVLAAVAVWATVAGVKWFALLAGLAGGAALFEWGNLFGWSSAGRWFGAFWICGGIAGSRVNSSDKLNGILVIALVGIILRESGMVETRHKYRFAEGTLLIALPGAALVWLRSLGDGLAWIAFTFAIVWSADIAAYAVGRAVGGPKLWPTISPNKTWAGFMGACLAAMLAGSVAYWFVTVATAGSATITEEVHLPLRGAIAGLLLGALAQGGDLFESALKRCAGVKDSGTLLPGHGGVLDRLDSLIPVAPAVAGAVALGWL